MQNMYPNKTEDFSEYGKKHCRLVKEADMTWT